MSVIVHLSMALMSWAPCWLSCCQVLNVSQRIYVPLWLEPSWPTVITLPVWLCLCGIMPMWLSDNTDQKKYVPLRQEPVWSKSDHPAFVALACVASVACCLRRRPMRTSPRPKKELVSQARRRSSRLWPCCCFRSKLRVVPRS